MREESLEFLKQIVNTPSPSGYEQKAQAVFREYAGRFADEVHTDVLGNSYAVINPEGYPRVMLSGHVDEIGFVVHYISDEGFIYFSPIGGHDSIVPVGHRVHTSIRSKVQCWASSGVKRYTCLAKRNGARSPISATCG
jgi:putative aminopeptidase FrvX